MTDPFETTRSAASSTGIGIICLSGEHTLGSSAGSANVGHIRRLRDTVLLCPPEPELVPGPRPSGRLTNESLEAERCEGGD